MIACYGVSKISSVLNQQKIKDIRHDMFTFLETNHSKLALRNPPFLIETKRQLEVPFTNLYPSQGMLLQHWGIGHAPFLWQLAASEIFHYEHFQRIMRLENWMMICSWAFLVKVHLRFPTEQPNVNSIEARKSSTSTNACGTHPFSVSSRSPVTACPRCCLPRRRDYSDRTGRQQHIVLRNLILHST